MTEGFDPANPWSFNAFDPPTPYIPPPSGRGHAPKTTLPDSDRLFSAQRDALNVLHGLDDLEREVKELRKSRNYVRLRKDAEDAYKALNRYLKDFENE